MNCNLIIIADLQNLLNEKSSKIEKKVIFKFLNILNEIVAKNINKLDLLKISYVNLCNTKNMTHQQINHLYF